MFNKKWKYKIGDIVSLPNIKYLGEQYPWKVDTPYTITSLYGNDHIEGLDGHDCMLDIRRFEYKYEKPLRELYIKLTENINNKNTHKDRRRIKIFIDEENTLTDKELYICKQLWEKYNKK